MVRGRKKNNCSPLKLRLVRVFSNGGTTSSSQPSSPTVPQRHSFHSTSLESLRFPSRPQSDGNLSLEPCLVSCVICSHQHETGCTTAAEAPEVSVFQVPVFNVTTEFDYDILFKCF
ncbi:uncharacterized protein LOC110834383 isoform X1 [Zootermopsis nevadensis]|uniref:uncharacterized protein LOC110834383 isoform X1 n=1 Tax=Zootermopsis nevadensis TaxID=136037 RepID=UPI000B8E85E2|nr:uncharacterized protein LOC110834383 isoform X1 [Zootermopsis nevadensis]